MKITKILCSSIIVASSIAFVQAQQQYEVKGTLKGLKTETVFMQYRTANGMKADSAKVINNTYKFVGTVPEVTMAAIIIPVKTEENQRPTSTNQVAVYLENGTATVFVDHDNETSAIGGTPLNEAEQKTKSFVKPFQVIEKSLENEFDKFKDNKVAQDSLREVYFYELDKFLVKVYDFLELNEPTKVHLNMMQRYIDPVNESERSEYFYNKLTKELQESDQGKAYAAGFLQMKAVELGAKAPDFILPGVDDKEISLSSFQGKYLLIDFWASWCGPCRQENPNLVAAYNEFKDKNFEIIGVSLDQGDAGKGKWIEAIAKDQLTWAQVRDAKSEAADQYKISSIPANFLVDPSGKIIAKNLRGKDLDKKLKEILN